MCCRVLATRNEMRKNCVHRPVTYCFQSVPPACHAHRSAASGGLRLDDRDRSLEGAFTMLARPGCTFFHTQVKPYHTPIEFSCALPSFVQRSPTQQKQFVGCKTAKQLEARVEIHIALSKPCRLVCVRSDQARAGLNNYLEKPDTKILEYQLPPKG